MCTQEQLLVVFNCSPWSCPSPSPPSCCKPFLHAAWDQPVPRGAPALPGVPAPALADPVRDAEPPHQPGQRGECCLPRLLSSGGRERGLVCWPSQSLVKEILPAVVTNLVFDTKLFTDSPWRTSYKCKLINQSSVMLFKGTTVSIFKVPKGNG